MKVAISLPDKLFEAADEVAGRLGISRSELYRRAVQHYLAELGDGVIRERLDAVYGDAGEATGLDPAIEHLQDASLPKDEW